MVQAGPIASVSVAVLAVAVCVTFVLTLLFTYTTCVLQSQCPALPQLPTVSDTWTHPPGNFVSREVTLSLGLSLSLSLSPSPRPSLSLSLSPRQA